MSNNKQMLRQGSFLAFSGVIVSIIGFVYRVPMTNMLGEGGAGIYSVAYNIYNIALTISSYSFPSGISKIISEQQAKDSPQGVRRIFSSALLLAALIGAFTALLVYFGRYALEIIYAKEGLALTMPVIAPTLFIMALLGVFRGYFQGMNNMVPTAVSQIIEQLVNAVLSLVLVSYCMNHFRDSSFTDAYGAAGSLGGTLGGAIAALLFIIAAYLLYQKKMSRPTPSTIHNTAADSMLSIWKLILLTTLPIAFAQMLNQLSGTLDDILFANIMQYKGFSQDVISAWQGVYGSQYSLLVRIPLTVATALSMAMLPSIAADYISRKKEQLTDKIHYILKIVTLFTIPSAVGISVLAMPILKVLFPSLTTYRSYAATLLYVGTSAIVLYSLSTITSTVMQTVHMRRKMLKNSIFALLFHVICVTLLLFFTNLGVYALCIGNILFPLTICLLNVRSLKQNAGLNINWLQLYLKPLICAAVMGVLTYACASLLTYLKISQLIVLIVSVIVGAGSYLLLLLKSHYLKKSEIQDLPLGRTFYQLLHRRS